MHISFFVFMGLKFSHAFSMLGTRYTSISVKMGKIQRFT
jgi:hypothetical protein